MKVKDIAKVTINNSIELLVWEGENCSIKYWNKITKARYGEYEVVNLIPICIAQTFTTDDEIRVVTKLRIEIGDVEYENH